MKGRILIGHVYLYQKEGDMTYIFTLKIMTERKGETKIQHTESASLPDILSECTEVAEGVLRPSPKGKVEVYLQPPPMRKERLLDLLKRWVWFLNLTLFVICLKLTK